jgi:hypothetical protein
MHEQTLIHHSSINKRQASNIIFLQKVRASTSEREREKPSCIVPHKCEGDDDDPKEFERFLYLYEVTKDYCPQK